MPVLNWIGKDKVVNHDKELPFRVLKLNEELSNYAWVDLKEAKEMNKQGKLIGKESSTGTFGQISQTKLLNRK